MQYPFVTAVQRTHGCCPRLRCERARSGNITLTLSGRYAARANSGMVGRHVPTAAESGVPASVHRDVCDDVTVSFRWIVDRQDPRTLLLLNTLILIAGFVIVPSFVRAGGVWVVIAVVWFIVIVAQEVRALILVRRWRSASQQQRR